MNYTYALSRPNELLLALGPEIVLLLGSMLLLLLASFRPDSVRHQRTVGIGSVVVTLLTLVAVIWYAMQDSRSDLGVIAVDRFRWAADVVFLIGTLATLLLQIDYNERERITFGESHVLVLFATSGMMLLAAARDLMIVFLGIELMSIATYVLAGVNRRAPRAAEASLKYFLLGAFSTGFLLYGIALVYGATASTNIVTIGQRVQELGLGRSPLLLVGIAMLTVGFCFKVAAAPFHMWAPDVYEGAPTPITAYMAAAVKAAAFASFLRVWIEAFPGATEYWHPAIWWLAAATMVVGNLIALAQRNIKRLLAYSSVAHAGYVLVAVVVGSPAATSAFLFYLLAYTIATMGAFAVVVALGSAGEPNLSVDDYSGLWTVRPGYAVAMAIFMLALLGFPLFGGLGFFAKWYVLQAALQAAAPQTKLAVILVLTSVVSCGYYLYVVMVMFMRPRAATAVAPAPVSWWTKSVIVAAALITVVGGLMPSPLVNWARRGVPELPVGAPAVPRSPGAPGLAPPTASAGAPGVAAHQH